MDAVSSQVANWPSDVRSLVVRAHHLTHMCSRKAVNPAVMSAPHIFEHSLLNTPSRLRPWGANLGRGSHGQ
jgi:hypothetical protein